MPAKVNVCVPHAVALALVVNVNEVAPVIGETLLRILPLHALPVTCVPATTENVPLYPGSLTVTTAVCVDPLMN